MEKIDLTKIAKPSKMALSFLLFMLLLFPANQLNANHVVTSKIHYTVINKTSTEVIVKLELLGVFSSVNTVTNTRKVYFEPSCGGSSTLEFLLSEVSRGYLHDYQLGCTPDSLSLSQVSNNFGYLNYVYVQYETIDTISIAQCSRGSFYNNFGVVSSSVFNTSSSMFWVGSEAYVDFSVTSTNSNIDVGPRNLLSYSCIDGFTSSGTPYMEGEGDSIFSKIVPNIDYQSVDTSSGLTMKSNVPFVMGYGIQTPFFTGQSFTFNNKTGVLSGNITRSQLTNVTYEVSEYAFTNLGYQLKSRTRYLQRFAILDSCGYNAPKFSFNQDSSIQSTAAYPLVNARCGDSVVKIDFTYPIDPLSVTFSGSEFRLKDASNNPIPIVEAQAFRDSVLLKTLLPLPSNDTLWLRVTTGMDGNTIKSECQTLMEKDTLLVLTTNCQPPLGAVESEKVELNVYPNPTQNELFVNVPFGINSKTKIEVLNTTGEKFRLPINRKSEHQISVRTNELSRGVYMLLVHSERETHTTKFIKE